MTPVEFRQLALSLPEAVESAHMGHPDFRVGGKIFATLHPGGERGMVKLSPQQQSLFVATESQVYFPVNGAWGRHGCTFVRLANASEPSVKQALFAAWQNTAPKSLAEQFDNERSATATRPKKSRRKRI